MGISVLKYVASQIVSTWRKERALLAKAARAWEKEISAFDNITIALKIVVVFQRSFQKTDFWVFGHGAVLGAAFVPSSDSQGDLVVVLD